MKTLELHDYEITLLTAEEYETHMEQIPVIACWWWLRSPGFDSSNAAGVHLFGSVYDPGNFVSYDILAVRPALKSDLINLPIGERFAALLNRWIVIDKGLAISEHEIASRRYDSESNKWETSELKAWLEAWAKEGEEAMWSKSEGNG